MSSAKAVYPKNPLSAFGGRFEVHRKLPKLDPSLKKKKTFVILTKLSSSELSKREDKERSQNSVKILQSKFISIFLNCH